MTGDIVQRLQAVRQWLEKAEKSYSNNKEMTGEINLIMAQAEMQRLKETREVPFWLRLQHMRIGALLAAVCILCAGSFAWHQYMLPTVNPAPEVITSRQSEQPAVVRHSSPEPAISSDGYEAAAPAPVPAPVPAADAENEIPAVPSAPAAVATVEEAAPPAGPSVQKNTVSAGAAAPVMSQAEIQRVVGEAGRTLRGQY